MKTAIYPGSFDPVTNGHLDVLSRALELFDRVVVGIATNTSKRPWFTKDERMELLRENLERFPNAEVRTFDGLTVDFAVSEGAVAIIRGLRAVSDFEYEFQLAQMNRHMNSDIETIFLMPNQEFFYTSSQLIKAISEFSPERIEAFVPSNVLKALKEKML